MPTKATTLRLHWKTFALLLIGAPSLMIGQTPPSPQQIRQQRADWFYSQRAYPNTEIPAGAREKALEQMDKMIANSESQGDSDAPAPGADWVLIGPSPTNVLVDQNAPNKVPYASGRVTALAVTPDNPDVVYLGAGEGGVWKSIDGGKNWDPISDTQKSLSIGAIAIDPNNADLVYAGTGESNFSLDNYYGAGVLRWDNSKKTWALTQTPFVGPFGPRSENGGAYIGAIAVSPTDGKVLLAGANFKLPGGSRKFSGIYRSDDSGQSWTRVLPTGPEDPFCKKSEYNNDQCGAPGTAVVFDPTDGTIAYAALGDPSTALNDLSAVYKSKDGGKTWALSQGGDLDTIIKGRVALDISRPDKGKPATLLAGVSDTGEGDHRSHGVYVSRDDGQTWKTIPMGALPKLPDYCNPECQYANVVKINPKNANQFFVGGTGQGQTQQTLYRSLDGGQNWQDVSASVPADDKAPIVRLHVDQHALAFDAAGSRLFDGNDGGVWLTLKPDAQNTPWQNMNNADKRLLAIAQFYPGISIDPGDSSRAFGGTQDNGTQRYSGKLEWEQVICGDGGYTAIDFNNSKNVYATCQNIDVRKSDMNGDRDSWAKISDSITGSSLFIAPLVMDTKDPAILYFGADNLWRTMNGDGPWKKIFSANNKISTVAVAPTDSKTVFLATQTGSAYVAIDGDQQNPKFVRINNGPLPNRFPTQVAVDPTDATIAYLVFSGFQQNKVGDSSMHVFKAKLAKKLEDTAWQDISGDLPDIPVNDIVIDPKAPANRLYIATDIGVFVTSNAGKNWTPLQAASLPRVAVLSLKLHQPTRTLRAGTHGRSMWELRVPEPQN